MAADLDANIWGVVGASGTGKGLWIKAHLRTTKPRRLVVWDFKREYGQFVTLVPTLAHVRTAMLKAGEDGALRIGYCPVGAGEKAMRREFEALCELVYAFEHCTFIAEELANVTTPGWAPAAWRKMTTSGRHAGVHIIGATQTPALVDKTFLGNCTLIHCSALREHTHRVAIARSIDVDEGRIARLVKLQWLEKNFDTGEVTTGFVRIPGQKVTRQPLALVATSSPPTATATSDARPPRKPASVPKSRPAAGTTPRTPKPLNFRKSR